jgi:hypothetical protein
MILLPGYVNRSVMFAFVVDVYLDSSDSNVDNATIHSVAWILDAIHSRNVRGDECSKVSLEC